MQASACALQVAQRVGPRPRREAGQPEMGPVLAGVARRELELVGSSQPLAASARTARPTGRRRATPARSAIASAMVFGAPEPPRSWSRTRGRPGRSSGPPHRPAAGRAARPRGTGRRSCLHRRPGWPSVPPARWSRVPPGTARLRAPRSPNPGPRLRRRPPASPRQRRLRPPCDVDAGAPRGRRPLRRSPPTPHWSRCGPARTCRAAGLRAARRSSSVHPLPARSTADLHPDRRGRGGADVTVP